MQTYGHWTQHDFSIILATSPPLIKSLAYHPLMFDTSRPCLHSCLTPHPAHPHISRSPSISSTTSVSSNHLTPFQIHPHQLADSVRFTQRARCSDPRKSMADKSMLSLFSMPLLPLIFSPLLLCCLWRLELRSINLSSLCLRNKL